MHFRLLRKLGVSFQLKFYEYHYHQMLNPLLEKLQIDFAWPDIIILA